MALYDAVLFMVLFVFYSLSLGWDDMTPKKVVASHESAGPSFGTTDL